VNDKALAFIIVQPGALTKSPAASSNRHLRFMVKR
jgi:hypothetical protein